MLRSLLASFLLMIPAGPVLGGAWPRDKGSTFVATGYAVFETETGLTQDEQTLYVEYGLSDKFTLGFSGSFNANSSGEGHAFLRYPLKYGDRAAVLALEFGLGVKTIDQVNFDPFVKTGLSWGRGLTLLDKNGWANIDSSVLWDLETSNHRFKLDATLGLNISDRVKLLGQSFVEITQTGQSLTLMPSVVFGTKSGKMQFVIGLDAKMGEGAKQGLRFGLWNTF